MFRERSWVKSSAQLKSPTYRFLCTSCPGHFCSLRPGPSAEEGLLLSCGRGELELEYEVLGGTEDEASVFVVVGVVVDDDDDEVDVDDVETGDPGSDFDFCSAKGFLSEPFHRILSVSAAGGPLLARGLL